MAGWPWPPSSVTATSATPSAGRITSTVNAPPAPDAVCTTALAASSETQVSSASRAGEPARAAATNARALATCRGSPGKLRARRAGPEPAVGASSGYAAVISITPALWVLSVRISTMSDGRTEGSVHLVTERMVPPLLPFVAAQRLTDHHCHGVLRSGGDVEALLSEGDGGACAGGTAFDSLAGLAFRRWCPPLLDLPAHASLVEYQERRAALGAAEVNRRFLGGSGLGALILDTGFAPDALLSPAEMAEVSGGRAFEIVRLEQ